MNGKKHEMLGNLSPGYDMIWDILLDREEVMRLMSIQVVNMKQSKEKLQKMIV